MNSHNAQSSLFSIAESQNGYFTSSQAQKAGISSSNQMYHVKTGNWIRKCRGVYRLKKYPFHDNEHYALWCVWSINRKGEMLGVLSHETALSIFELSDLNPTQIHLTVPRGFRRHSEIPPVLKLHFSDIQPGEYEQREGYKVTKPFKTIADCIRDRKLSDELIVQAVRDGLQKGTLTRTQYEQLQKMPRIGTILKSIMGDIA